MTRLASLTTAAPLPCREDPDRWYSGAVADRVYAVAGCRGCPLRRPCARYALDTREEWGVWGGLTPADRRALLGDAGWRLDDEGRMRRVCGSVAAFFAHFTYGEQPCEACRRAYQGRLEADRRARLEVEHEAGGSVRGYQLHRLLGEPACEVCRAALARESRAWRQKQREAAGAPESTRGPGSAAEGLRGAPGGAQAVQTAA